MSNVLGKCTQCSSGVESLGILLLSASQQFSSHDVTTCGDDVVHIQSGSSSWSARYGDSSSSNCFLSASFCIHFMASVKGAESTSHFNTPPRPAPGSAGESKDIGVSRLDPRPEPGAQEIPTSMGKPGGRPSSSRLSHLVTGEATPLARPPTPESPVPPEVGRWMGGMVVVSSP